MVLARLKVLVLGDVGQMENFQIVVMEMVLVVLCLVLERVSLDWNAFVTECLQYRN